METIGVRELKAHLSRHLKRVRAGARLIVTDRGRAIATVAPVEAPQGLEWVHRMVSEGRARWSGGKPAGHARPPRVKRGREVAAAVLEDRG